MLSGPSCSIPRFTASRNPSSVGGPGASRARPGGFPVDQTGKPSRVFGHEFTLFLGQIQRTDLDFYHAPGSVDFTAEAFCLIHEALYLLLAFARSSGSWV